MIYDPDGTSAICDDGTMAIPIMWSELDQYGVPTGGQVFVGWADPTVPWWAEEGPRS
jgi:hypothetical protein